LYSYKQLMSDSKSAIDTVNEAHQRAIHDVSEKRLSDNTIHLYKYYTGLFLHFYFRQSLTDLNVSESYWDNHPIKKGPDMFN
jgi:hypothetical protein